MARRPHLTSLVLLTLCAQLAPAQEERELPVPVSSRWLVGATAAEVGAVLAQGFRIHDLEVASASPLEFDAVLVRNTGPYARAGWWWYYGLTAQQVEDRLVANRARPIDIDAYTDGNGALRYAVVMVWNGGSAAKTSWHFLQTTTAAIATHLQTDNARIVDLDSFLVGRTRYYSAITIHNSGADARAWWWWIGQSQAQVEALLQQNSADLIDLERTGTDRFDAVMVRAPRGVSTWQYFDVSEAELIGRLAQHGARLIDVEQHGSGLQARYDIVLMENTDGFAGFGAGCAGSGGVPVLFGAGTPALGENIAFGLSSCPADQWGVLFLGFSNTQWNGNALPLAIPGAPGCLLQVEPLASMPVYSNASGVGRSSTIPVPVVLGLVDNSVFGQLWVPDPGTNALGIVATNGVEVRIRA